MVIAILLALDARRRRRERRRRRRARERIYRPRINVFGMGDSEVYHIFRFSPTAILELTTTLKDEITSQTHCSQAVEPLVKVLATLFPCQWLVSAYKWSCGWDGTILH